MNFLAIYLMYTLLSLIAVAVAVAVSVCLMAVGVILVNAHETKELAHSVNVVSTVHGNFVITRQLLSLSFSLGAFATFFLVAGQRNDERQAFMRHMLSKLRCTLLIYTVYCRAYDHAPTWTGIAANSPSSAQRGEADGHDLKSSLSHRGRPTSWVAVAIIISGFIVGGIAMVAGPVWWLFLTGAGIIVTGGVFALSWRIFDDWY
jgi:cell division protein FtsW (lipid II flippase)